MRTPTSQMSQRVYDLSRNNGEAWWYHKDCGEVCQYAFDNIRDHRRNERQQKGAPRRWYVRDQTRELSHELFICRLASGWLRIQKPLTERQNAEIAEKVKTLSELIVNVPKDTDV